MYGADWNQADNDPLMRWDFFVKYHSDDAMNAKYNHLVWRTTDGEFYVGLEPPAGATQLGVYYPRTGTLGGEIVSLFPYRYGMGLTGAMASWISLPSFLKGQY